MSEERAVAFPTGVGISRYHGRICDSEFARVPIPGTWERFHVRTVHSSRGEPIAASPLPAKTVVAGLYQLLVNHTIDTISFEWIWLSVFGVCT